MYEARGNIWWLAQFPEDERHVCAVMDKPSWDLVVDVQERHFSSPFHNVFPVAMLAHVQTSEIRILPLFPDFAECLTLVTGHVFLYAWLLGMLRALQSASLPAVASLWRAGLTMTIRVRAGLSTTDLALLCLQHSGQLQAQELHGKNVAQISERDRRRVAAAGANSEAGEARTLRQGP
jgi:hypothetical protein